MRHKPEDLLQTFLFQFKMTQTDFADQAGLSRTSIYKYLKGHKIHRQAARKIANTISDIIYKNLID